MKQQPQKNCSKYACYINAIHKDSYSRVNESKQQLNSFIIYDLDSIARVNDNSK